jgi:carbamoyl-phosphate synthase large subunit
VRVAITGVGGGVGQAVVHSLRLSSLPLHLLGLDASAWSVGLYQCDEARLVPRVDNPAYADAVLAAVAEHAIDALIPGTDTELPALSDLRERLAEKSCRTVISSPDFVRVARDKLACEKALCGTGIPFVQTLSAPEFARGCTEDSFPAILKPKGGSGSVGTRVLFSSDDLDPAWIVDGNIVQEYLIPAAWGVSRLTRADVVRGGRLRQDEELSVQGMVAPDGTVVGIFISVNELRDGVVMKVRPTDDPELRGLSARLFRILADMGHVGPCNVEGRITARGPVFYELNPRFTGVSAARAEMGFNECDAGLRLFAADEPAAAVAATLRPRTDLVSLRYITEYTVPRADLERVRKTSPATSPRSA